MLTENEIQNLKNKLETEQRRLVEELSRLEKPEAIDMGSDVSDSTGTDEDADKIEELDTNLGLMVPLKERLEGIKATLFKIEQGKFGFCEKCATEIDQEVLAVDPESRWCRGCKIKDLGLKI